MKNNKLNLDKKIYELFEEQVEKTPNNIALSFEGEKLTYRELNIKVNSLAYTLKEEGIKSNDIVGIMVDRSIEMIVSILAILKSDGAYLPLDTKLPVDRINYMLSDCKAKLVLTQDKYKEKILKNCKVLDVNDENIYSLNTNNISKEGVSSDLAYVIYTSGTTGKPKGTLIEHKSILNTLLWEKNFYKFSEKSVVLQLIRYSFDGSIEEIFVPLISGGKLVLIDQEKLFDIEYLKDIMKKEGVTSLSITPAFYNILLKNNLEEIKTLEKVTVAGEGIKKQVVKKHFDVMPNVRLVNEYGPTENSICSTFYEIKSEEKILIGKPISNVQAFVLDNKGKKVSIEETGELCLSGVGLARGYLNNEKQTLEKFVENPYLPGERMYKTGDLVRWTSDGNLEFLGRIDDQVKIRGFRIELGEIENKLIEVEGIKEAVVLDKGEDDNKYICAYYVADKEYTQEYLKKELSKYLLEYMVPSFFIKIESIPLTQNGKIDKTSLLNMEENIEKAVYEAPRNNIEKSLVRIWSESLNINNIGINDNFSVIGGHSINAMDIITRINKEMNKSIPLKELFKLGTIKNLGEYIENCAEESLEENFTAKTMDKEYLYEPFPLTGIQLAYLVGRNKGFEIGGVASKLNVEFEVDVDIDRFNIALQKMIDRHDTYRTIINDDGTQVIRKLGDTYKVEVIDYSHLSNEEVNKLILEERQKLLERDIDPYTWPLFSIKAFILNNKNKYFFMDMDPLIGDDSSLRIMIQEFKKYYNDINLELPPLEYSFRDYVLELNNFKNSKVYKKDKEFWMKKVDDFPSAPKLPMKCDPSNIVRPNFLKKSKIIEGEMWQRIKEKARKNNVTIASLLCAAYAYVLGFWSNEKEFSVNLTVFNRIPFHKDVKKLIGDFTTLMLLDINTETAKESFWKFASLVQDTLLEALEHRNYDGMDFIRTISRKSNIENGATMPIVFTSVLSENSEDSFDNLLDFSKIKFLNTRTSQVYIDNQVYEINGGLFISWDYVEQLFEPEVIDTMFNQYIDILNQVSESNEISRLKVTKKDKLVIDKYNDTDRVIDVKPLHELFVDAVKENADKIALKYHDKTVTYKELDEKSNKVARYLINEGVNKGDYVGVIAKRSIETIVNLLGILKSGAAYIPVDPEYPIERINYIKDKSNCKLFLSKESYEENNISKYSSKKVDIKVTNTDMAYVIFTSGSTGMPKGVKIAHGAAANTILDINEKYLVGKNDKILGISSLCFDLSVYDVFGALVSGAELVIIDDQRDVFNLKETIEKEKITIWNSVPSIMGMLTDSYNINEKNESLRVVLLSGDWIPLNLPDRIKNIFTSSKVISLGGATEGAIWSIYYPINEVKKEWNSIPYGRPLSNQKFYVLNEYRDLCPVGVKGELYIGGAGVAEGYINDNEKTEAAFIYDKNLGYIYKTGDYGILNTEGYIEFLGRKDNQVKIRGYRVELGEIENCLLECKDVKKVVVTDCVNDNGGINLNAFIISDVELDYEILRKHAGLKLPQYMIPSKFIKIDKVPLTVNGKVDKKKLNKIAEKYQVEEMKEETLSKPETKMQSQVLNVWEEVLKVENIGIDDSYYKLGVDSLKIISIITEINKKLKITIPIAAAFKNRTIRDMAEYLENMKTKADSFFEKEIKTIAKKDYYETSPAQRRMYMLEMMNSVGAAYHIPVSLLIEGSLNTDKLKSSLNKVLKRHEILRTGFEIIDNKIVQKVYDDVTLNVEYKEVNLDFSNEDSIKEFATNEYRKINKSFDLSKPPLMKSVLVKLKENKYLLLVDFHHIIVDGMSQEIFIDDLLEFYKGNEVPSGKIQYKDYAAWYNEFSSSEELEKEEKYWLDLFKEKPAKLKLPYDYKRPVDKSFNGENIYFKLSSILSNKIKELAKDTESTLYMIMLTAYYVLLYKYTGEEDVVIGSVSSGRLHKDLEDVFGMFVNTIALRNKVDGTKSFKDFLQEVKESSITSFKNSNYDFDKLIEKLPYDNERNRNPLFDTMFVVEDSNLFVKHADNIKLSPVLFNLDNAKFDIAMAAIDGDEITLNIEYCTDLFKKETVLRFVNHYINILEEVTKNKDNIINNIDMLSKKEQEKIFKMCCGNKLTSELNYTIQELFEEQVNKTPEKIAIVYGKESITYKELNSRANKVANRLRKLNIQPDNVVGIMINRSIDMVIGVLGILKSGAAYVPIDTELPPERIRYILNDSNTRIMLVEDKTIEKLDFIKDEEFSKININDKSILEEDEGNLINVNTPKDLAYIIYTSGSTGKPKGVMIEHKGIANIKIMSKYELELNSRHKVLQVASISFDISVWEIFATLLLGAELHVITKDIINNYNYMEEYIVNNKITHATFTPNYLANLDSKVGNSLETLLTGGSAANMEVINKWKDKVGYVNGYGPTETTICSTLYTCTDELNKYRTIPIGKPISNTQLYILDNNFKCQPIGVVGELYIAGIGLARGYLNREELTKEKFIDNPFEPGSKMYGTGDLVKLLEDGNIEYIGRIDNQVKVRGYRIELGEIENQLLKNKDIKDAIVITRKDENDVNYIYAYIIPENNMKDLNIDKINKFLKKELPEYMIPSYIIPMESMPLTTNGKVDKAKLPIPIKEVALDSYEEPRGEVEEKLSEIWMDVLNISKVGRNNNFFELGGQSLKAIILVSKIQKEFGIEISLNDMFKCSTIAENAELINNQKTKDLIKIDKAIEKEYYAVSSAQKRIFALNQVEEGVAYNIPIAMKLKGKLDIDKCKEVFKKIVERHEVLRTRFLVLNGEVVQKVDKEVDFNIVISILGEKSIKEKVNEFIKPFDLDKSPLFRVEICNINEEENLLLIDMHHIISDGVSTGIILSDFSNLYYGRKLDPLKLQYKDYSEWEKSIDNQNRIKESEKYWLDKFSDEVPVLNMLVDYERTKTQNFSGKKISLKLDSNTSELLRNFAKENGVTMYMLYLASYSLLLSRYTGQDDIVIGSPVIGRRNESLNSMVGMFVNTLAMRNFPKADETFIEYLKTVKENSLKSYENQDYPFDDLVEKLNIKREVSRNPLFDIMFAYEDDTDVDFKLEDLDFEMINIDNNTSKFDITLTARASEKEMLLEAEYSTKLYKEETIQRMLKNLVTLLINVVENPNLKLTEIEFIDKYEKDKVLNRFNSKSINKTNGKTIIDLFEEQVLSNPDNIAVVYDQEKLTFKELNERANSLGRVLREKGIAKDSIVGLMIGRSTNMIVGILAILKAGGAYLPIDLEYPKDRVNYMLENSKCNLVLTESKFKDKIEKQLELVFIDDKKSYDGKKDNLEKINDENSLSYVIYTSGTTGKPKGVMIEHKSVVNLVKSLDNVIYSKYTKKIKTSLVAAYVFDASVQQIFASLLLGNELYIVPEEDRKDGGKLLEFYNQNNIQVSDGTPMHLSMIINSDFKDYEKLKVKHFIIGGDKLSKNLAKSICEKMKNNKVTITNVYGPTECCVDSTYKDINIDNVDNYTNIPIGKPLNNYKVYILNNNTLCPIGVHGELCIGGIGLARGYLSNEELTNEKFVNNPYELGEKMYRTGDLARWTFEGEIDFLGRMDKQVKIRGFRIELGEIEKNLLNIEGVKEACVIDKVKDDSKYLCAYYVGEKDYSVKDLREELEKNLPEYMIPSYFVKLDCIPLTKSGKIDRRSLPEPRGNINTGDIYEAPRNKLEEILVDIWYEVLGVDNIGINDNFFNLGGDSIKAIQVISRAKVKGYYFTVKNLFENTNIKSLSPLVRLYSNKIEQGEVKGEVKLTPIQKRYFNNKEELNHYNQAFMFKNEKGFNEEVIKKVFNKILEHHDALRMIFRKDKVGNIVQYNRAVNEVEAEVYIRDLRENNNFKEKIEELSNKIQKSIDIFEGALLKVCIFKTNKADYLLIVINHLVIDGVSWRILYDDIRKLYKQALNNEELILESKSTSFKDYADKLNKYANTKKLLREEKYWSDILDIDINFIKKNKEIENHAYGESKTLTITLNKKETNSLLKNTNRVYNTQINDILLTALASTIKYLTKEDKIRVFLEGHGREDILSKVDTSRTIGWFTTIYPVLLDIKEKEDISYNIKTVKETLRSVPDKGFGYGVLKYISNKFKSHSEEEPDILFNYLGEMDNTMDSDEFAISNLSVGESVGHNVLRTASIEINSVVINGELNISSTFNEEEYDKEVIENMNNIFKAELIRIINHCVSKETVEKTPSDYYSADVTLEELDKLKEKYKDYEIEKIYPLNNMQQGMLFHSLKDTNSNAYTEQLVISLEGKVDLDVITDLFNKVINKHEVLRSLFEYEICSNYKQVVMEKVHVDINYHDVRENVDKEQWLDEFISEDRNNGFNLAKELPTRISLIRIKDNSYKIVWTHHHIILDGWSVGIILEDIFDVYKHIKVDKNYLVESKNNYEEYIKWLNSQDKEEGIEYWAKYLEGYNREVMIPRTREVSKEYLSRERYIEIPEEITKSIVNIANNNKVTVNTVLQNIWSIILAKYNNTDDVVFGSVISGRENITEIVDKMAGLFINTIPTRVVLDKDKSFRDMLKITQERNLESIKYNYMNLSEIQTLSILNTNLLNHVMVFENYSFNEDIIKDNKENEFKITDIDSKEETNYDFNLIVIPGNNITLKLIYDGNVYDEEIVDNIERHINKVLNLVINNEDIKIGDINIVTDEEIDILEKTINNTRTNYPKDKTMNELFEEQVEKNPDNIAVVFEDKTLTYRELNEKANEVAKLLRDKGVDSKSIVGIKVDRSLEMMVGIMAILKSGAGYLPIDTEAPKDITKYMIKDSKVNILLTKEQFVDDEDNKLEYIILDVNNIKGSTNNLETINKSDDVAYIIYTSGSTGNPKGVIINHYSAIRVVKDTNYIDINNKDVILQLSNYSFDGSIFDIYGALLNGGKLVMLRKETLLDLSKLSKLMKDEKVTITFMTTALFNTIVDTDISCFDTLKKILFGGERVTVKYVEKALEYLGENKILHVYGPTESAVYTTYYPINKVEEGSKTIPIGKPLANTKVYVLDEEGNIVPMGVEGELCIAGDGLSRGYLNNEELTNKKFVKNMRGEKIYKTGDLVKMLPDGNIEFIGRIDNQVKIRGHRVELGEIENELIKNSSIKDVAVIAKQEVSGTYNICAYIVSEEDIDLEKVKDELGNVLPKYMLPTFYIKLDKMPLTKNGKIDKKALPEPDINIINNTKYEGPRNDIESKIVELWQEVLGIDKVSISDNFFEIGGNSLKVMHVINSINKMFNSNISIDEFFKKPTIKDLVSSITGAEETLEEFVEDSI